MTRDYVVYLAIGAAIAVSFSNAVCQILLGAAILALIISRRKWRIPPVALPLGLFVLWTLLSLAFSPDPKAGIPQLKKFYVFLMLPVLYTAVKQVIQVRYIVLAWGVFEAASSLRGFWQFWHKRQEAVAQGSDFYNYYVANRATGFTGMWMTFSGELMIASLMLAGLLLFRGVREKRAIWGLLLGIIAVGLAIAWTRSVWVGAAIGGLYLIAMWRPKLLLAAPVIGVVLFFLAPQPIRERFVSIYQPHGDTDSNKFRRIMVQAGMQMVRTHPVLGLGPEVMKRELVSYIPDDVPRPLPPGFYQHLHNVYLQYAAERGLPALAFFLWFIGKVLVDFFRAARSLAPDEHLRRAILHGAVAAIIALLVEGFAEHNLGDSEILTMFFVVVACGYIARREPAHA